MIINSLLTKGLMITRVVSIVFFLKCQMNFIKCLIPSRITIESLKMYLIVSSPFYIPYHFYSLVKQCVSDMNILLNTLALINPVGYIEYGTPIKTDFFILIFTMHMSIRISVCSLFCPCHPYICISPHFSPSHIL